MINYGRFFFGGGSCEFLYTVKEGRKIGEREVE